MSIKKAAREIRKASRTASRQAKPVAKVINQWMILPKAGEVGMKTIGDCPDAVLHIPLTEVVLSGHRKLLIRSSWGTTSRSPRWKTDRPQIKSGAQLCVMWDSMRNVDVEVAECTRIDHTCPNIIRWYVSLLQRLAQHPDTADSSRIWAAQKLLDREAMGMDEKGKL